MRARRPSGMRFPEAESSWKDEPRVNSAPRALHGPALRLQKRNQHIALVALDLDRALFDRAAAAAALFEFLAELDETTWINWSADHEGHALALASFCFAGNAHDAVVRAARGLLANATDLGLAAVRAHRAAETRGPDGAVTTTHGFLARSSSSGVCPRMAPSGKFTGMLYLLFKSKRSIPLSS